MVITRKYASRLVQQGKGKFEGITYLDGATYDILTRYDLQRTDHVYLSEGDIRYIYWGEGGKGLIKSV